MNAEDAIELIFARLCRAHLERRAAGVLSRAELGASIPQDIFMRAMRHLRGPNNDQDLRIRFLDRDPDTIALGAVWRRRCEEQEEQSGRTA